MYARSAELKNRPFANSATCENARPRQDLLLLQVLCRGKTSKEFRGIFKLLVEEFFQPICILNSQPNPRQEKYLVIRRRLAVIGSTIIEDQFSIVNELVWRRVLVGIQFLFHRRQVHRFLDNRVIVGDFFFVDGLHERPGGGMVLHFGEDHLHGGKVRGSFGSSCELVHFRSPSRFLYSLMTCSSGDCTYARDGEGVNRDAGLDVQCWVYEFRVSDLFDTS
jgi:hypothetical protein